MHLYGDEHDGRTLPEGDLGSPLLRDRPVVRKMQSKDPAISESARPKTRRFPLNSLYLSSS
jgi:hypothetical protein